MRFMRAPRSPLHESKAAEPSCVGRKNVHSACDADDNRTVL